MRCFFALPHCFLKNRELILSGLISSYTANIKIAGCMVYFSDSQFRDQNHSSFDWNRNRNWNQTFGKILELDSESNIWESALMLLWASLASPLKWARARESGLDSQVPINSSTSSNVMLSGKQKSLCRKVANCHEV